MNGGDEQQRQQIASLQREGLALLQSNRFAEAKALYARLCELNPQDAESWYRLGTLSGMLGNIDEAGECCRKVIAIRPDHGEAHATLGNVLFHKGDHAAAIDHYQTALRINPGNAVAHNNLGNVLKSTGRLAEAIESYKRAVAANPGYAIAHYNLGIALREAMRSQEAVTAFNHAVTLNPNHAEAHNNLGLALKSQNRLEEARQAIQRALAIKPAYAEAHYNLANIYFSLGELEAAVEHFREAVAVKPDYADAYNNLGNALKALGRDELAMENYKHAIALNPQHARAYNNLGVILRDRNRVSEAEEMVQQALRSQPDFADAYNTLGNIRSWQGKPDAAEKLFQRVLELDPSNASAHSNLLMMMQYEPRYSPAELLRAAQDWNARHTQGIERLPPPASLPDPERRLRIGYVSGDFCSHPVGFFIEGVLARHDKHRHEIFCYYSSNDYDPLTARLQTSADHWRAIDGHSDQSVADRIRQDGIDILVDLSGHSRNHRLLAFAYRPAPLQLTWMGYFATTGVAAIDYIIADRFVIPPEEERYYSERVERLPHCYLCFTAPDLPIPVSPPPVLSRGNITFGCFNNPAKITPQVIACWSKLLQALPGARLKLKYKFFEESAATAHFVNAFAAHGIDARRLDFAGQSPRSEYLADYNGIDIALDPFPFNGCTTSVEALWMGIPVITLRGDRFAGHMGDTILNNLALQECVADSAEAYIEKALALAADPPRLAELRSGLRERLLTSPLCDAATFTRDLEALYRELWTRWCQKHSVPDAQ